MTFADPADPTGGLFDQLTTYLVPLAHDLGFQVDLADLDPVCGIGSSQVLDWAKTGARHATLAYQRRLLAAPIAFLKQDPDGTHDHALADLLNQDRWLDQAQDQARRQYAAACRTLFGLGLGLIWPDDETAFDSTSGSGDPVPDGSTVTPAAPAEDDEPTTSEPSTEPTATDTEIDHGHSR